MMKPNTIETYSGEYDGFYQTLNVAISTNGNLFKIRELELKENGSIDYDNCNFEHISIENYKKINETMYMKKSQSFDYDIDSIKFSSTQPPLYKSIHLQVEESTRALATKVGNRNITQTLLSDQKGNNYVVFSRTDTDGSFKIANKGEQVKVTYNTNETKDINYIPYTGDRLKATMLKAIDVQLSNVQQTGAQITNNSINQKTLTQMEKETEKKQWFNAEPIKGQKVDFEKDPNPILKAMIKDQEVNLQFNKFHKEYLKPEADTLNILGKLEGGKLEVDKVLSYMKESFTATVGHIASGDKKTTVTAYINDKDKGTSEARYINVPGKFNKQLENLKVGDFIAIKGNVLESKAGHKSVHPISFKTIAQNKSQSTSKEVSKKSNKGQEISH